MTSRMKAEIWTKGGGILQLDEFKHLKIGLSKHFSDEEKTMMVHIDDKELMFHVTLVDVHEKIKP